MTKRKHKTFAILIAVEIGTAGVIAHAAGFGGYVRAGIANYACNLEEIDYQSPQPHVHNHVAEFEVGGEVYVIERTTTTYNQFGSLRDLCDGAKSAGQR